MDTVDEFKNAYAELESIIKKYEDKNNDDLIENSSIITKMKECEFITACRRMRNILVHQKSKYKGKTIDFFEPNEEVILKLKKNNREYRTPQNGNRLFYSNKLCIV